LLDCVDLVGRHGFAQPETLDLVAATIGLVLLSPLFVAVAVMIKLDSRGPVFFRQVRMGAGGRTFRVLKFRTMVVDAENMKLDVAHLNMHNGGDARMFKVPDDPRVTGLGKALRRWRIDELPQLLNVVSGKMSIVGPRPLILDEDQHVSNWARRRLDLKPGITGLWQVLGASDIPFEEMISEMVDADLRRLGARPRLPRISRSLPSSLSLNMAFGNAWETVASISIGSDLATQWSSKGFRA
jgi:lipopolysaccharide/colanic/teichoic acid biosynthesis glycosyltransferase